MKKKKESDLPGAVMQINKWVRMVNSLTQEPFSEN